MHRSMRRLSEDSQRFVQDLADGLGEALNDDEILALHVRLSS